MPHLLLLNRILKRISDADDLLFFVPISSQTGEFGYGANWHPSVKQAETNAEELIEIMEKELGWKRSSE